MKKRTLEDQENELDYIHNESLRIAKVLAVIHRNDEAMKLLQEDAARLTHLIQQRERTDRCYYCGSRKRELGTQRDTGLTQCIVCSEEEMGVRFEWRMREAERRNMMGNW